MSFLFSHLSQRGVGVLPASLLLCLSLSSSAVVAEEVEVTAEVAKLLALDGQAGDFFGVSVSLDGDRLAIGAYLDDDNGSASGSAYVFERDADGSWFQVSKLLPLDGQAGDRFGVSVSLDGDRLAIGAYQDDDNGSESGSVYVFERDADGSWFEVSKLLPLDGQAGDRFGVSVSLDGDRLAIGAYQDDDNGLTSGSAYVFERDADGSWLEVAKLLPLDGQAGDQFGFSVSLDGDRLAIGAYTDDDNGTSSGSAYVFERDADAGGFEVSKLLALDGQAGDQFGFSVSLDGDRLAIGAYADDDNGSESGSAYVFERDADAGWFQVSKLLPLDGQRSDHFGIEVSLDGDRVAIGAFTDDDSGSQSGSAYVFEPVLVSPQLTLSGTCPGEVQLTSTGTTPRSGIRLYSSAVPGTSTFDSGPCAGTSLGLDRPTVMGQTNTDFDAENSRVRTLDASKCGTYLQMIDLKTCLTSEVVQVQ